MQEVGGLQEQTEEGHGESEVRESGWERGRAGEGGEGREVFLSRGGMETIVEILVLRREREREVLVIRSVNK